MPDPLIDRAAWERGWRDGTAGIDDPPESGTPEEWSYRAGWTEGAAGAFAREAAAREALAAEPEEKPKPPDEGT